MKTTILLTIEHTKPLPEITDVICQRVWPYGGGCITDMTAAIQEDLPSAEPIHVGDSSFEDLYRRKGEIKSTIKQLARDAYAAGMGDRLVYTGAPGAVGVLRHIAALDPRDIRQHMGEIDYQFAIATSAKFLAKDFLESLDRKTYENAIDVFAAAEKALSEPVSVSLSDSGTIRVGNETFSKERMREAIKAGRAQP